MISVRAIVFDLVGSLFDHVASTRRGLRSWLLGVGVELTDELDVAWFEAKVTYITSWRHGLVSWEEQRRLRLRDFLPLFGWVPGSDDALASRAVGLQAVHLDRITHGLTRTDDRIATITELSAVVTRTHP